MSSCDDLGEVDILVDDPAGETGELHVVAAGVVAQLVERGRQLQAAVLGQDTFGLLDDDTAVEGELKLLVEQSPRWMARSCRMPIVATSASACPSRRRLLHICSAAARQRVGR